METVSVQLTRGNLFKDAQLIKTDELGIYIFPSGSKLQTVIPWTSVSYMRYE